MMYGSREEQQHMNGAENILLKCCATTGVRNEDQKSSGRPGSGAAFIPHRNLWTAVDRSWWTGLLDYKISRSVMH
ncbi:hypothetical protein TNCV_1376021 [Trichonephila clavipes]|nr:hypothetical protein TNCV_1376021 [Trichonephila clavipes]